MPSVKSTLKELLFAITPAQLRNFYVKEEFKRLPSMMEYSNYEYYGQEGEDLVLQRFFHDKNSGFFVDVGAHHPIRFSNTYHFYHQGWRGVNIDAMPSSMNAFKEVRPLDFNIESPVSDSSDPVTFYIFEEPALNTFDPEVAKLHQEKGWPLAEKRELKPSSLEKILDGLSIPNVIDFMSIDVEGHEMNVLRSNNWEKYAPTMILIEMLNSDMENVKQNPLHLFLESKQYKIVAKTYYTFFYKRQEASGVLS